MFFGKKETGFMNQPTAVNMVNQPGMEHGMMPGMMPGMEPGMAPGMGYEGFGPDRLFDGMCDQAPMGYVCEPCDPCHHVECIEKPEPQIYVVQKGDTVYKIAQRFGLDWRELAGYNHLGNPDLIYPGERLFIPPRF